MRVVSQVRDLTIVCVVSAVCAGCIEATPPVFPPPESLNIDLSRLVIAPEAAQLPVDDESIYANFAEAFYYFDWVRANNAALVAIPFSAVSQLYATEPVREGVSWRYSGSVQGLDVDILTTSGANGTVLELLVTRLELGLNRFLWMEGTVSVDGQSGSWLLRRPDFRTLDNGVMRIDWQVDANGSRTTTFTNIDAVDEDMGDVLVYLQAESAVAVTYEDASEVESRIEIHWDRTNSIGSIESALYRDGEVSCWGETYENVPCPEEP